MRISDWSSDVCSSDLVGDRIHDLRCAAHRNLRDCFRAERPGGRAYLQRQIRESDHRRLLVLPVPPLRRRPEDLAEWPTGHEQSRLTDLCLRRSVAAHRDFGGILGAGAARGRHHEALVLPQSRRGPHRSGLRYRRSEEHTSELQSLMRISYAVFCLKKKTTNKYIT